jgi:hypothetical protein
MIETRTMAARTITALLVSFACLGLSASAMAAEIARPLFWKTTVRIKPNGPTDGVILAAARSGGPSGFLVLKTREVEGQEWLALRIGERPNDRVGWVPAFRVEVIEARNRLLVSVVKRTMTLFLNGKAAWKTRVIVGKPSTPTPRGLFAVHDFYRVKDDLRPWVVETTAHSEVLMTFLGGPARVALHGRHGALRAPWGTAVSNGCIRTPDWALRSIRKNLPPGSPIEIR